MIVISYSLVSLHADLALNYDAQLMGDHCTKSAHNQIEMFSTTLVQYLLLKSNLTQMDIFHVKFWACSSKIQQKKVFMNFSHACFLVGVFHTSKGSVPYKRAIQLES